VCRRASAATRISPHALCRCHASAHALSDPSPPAARVRRGTACRGGAYHRSGGRGPHGDPRAPRAAVTTVGNGSGRRAVFAKPFTATPAAASLRTRVIFLTFKRASGDLPSRDLHGKRFSGPPRPAGFEIFSGVVAFPRSFPLCSDHRPLRRGRYSILIGVTLGVDAATSSPWRPSVTRITER